jgi:hypothetical protein
MFLLESLDNLKPAPKVTAPPNFRPGVEFDGSEGTATTPGFSTEPNFDEFLVEAGFDPAEIEIVGIPRTSRWQRWDGEWLTSYKFQFRKRDISVNLPLLIAEARRKAKASPLKKTTEKCLVILWTDLQVGKVDYRGGTEEFVSRMLTMQSRLVELVKTTKPERIIFADLGDTIEGFENTASTQQVYSNSLSIMEQVDLAATMAWQTIKQLAKYAPVTYASVGSNHCQFRINKQVVGKPTDDWAIFIGRQLAKLAKETNLPITFLEPQPHDESLAVDVFGDGFHILGLVHGHQASRPDEMGKWWRGQAFGRQAIADATLLIHGHWHHLRVTELGSTNRGTSRFIVMGTTLDNGSGWWRLRTGEDSVPGLTTLTLEKGVDYSGQVLKL